jgi:hypothetical protein
MRLAVFAVLVACSSSGRTPEKQPLPPPDHKDFTVTTQQQNGPRLVPPEAYLRAYLEWFGGVGPREVHKRARGWNLFDDWYDYLAALGLPDYKLDVPRATQSNTMMLATLGRLGEALCIRAAERDLMAARGKVPLAERKIYAFEEYTFNTVDQFAVPFDVLHRTFLGYPVGHAEKSRLPRFFELYQRVASRHATTGRLSASQTAWAAVCTALVMHPETELY